MFEHIKNWAIRPDLSNHEWNRRFVKHVAILFTVGYGILFIILLAAVL